MKELFYTYQNAHGRPIVTVCLLKKGRQFARGIALCSKLDHTNGQIGEVKALGRAKKAIKRETACLPVNRDEAIRLLFEADAPPFKCKSEFPAKLTALESHLLVNAR